MQLQTGIPPERGKDALNDPAVAARIKSETGSNDDAKAVLLNMADIMKIVLDVKVADE